MAIETRIGDGASDDAQNTTGYSQEGQAFPFLVEKLGFGISQSQEEGLRLMGQIDTPKSEPTYYLTGKDSPYSKQTERPSLDVETQAQQVASGLLGTEQILFDVSPIDVSPLQELPTPQLDVVAKIEKPKPRYVLQMPQDYEYVMPHTVVLNKKDSIETRAKLLTSGSGFRRRHAGRRMREDITDQIHRPPQTNPEQYLEEIREEARAGRPSSSEYGAKQIGGVDCTVVATHYEHKAGAAGVGTGENVKHAAERATRRDEPLILLADTGGVDVKGGVSALASVMVKATHEIRKFKKKTDKPFIVASLHKMCGGITAGLAPMADVGVALLGGEIVFAGKRVKEHYQKRPVLDGEESTEANILNRNVMLGVRDGDQLELALERIIKHTTNRHKMTTGEAKRLPLMREKPFVRFSGQNGLHNLFDQEFNNDMLTPAGEPAEVGAYPAPDEYKNFLLLKSDARRPDAEYLMHQCFENVVPLSNNFDLKRPAITFALGELQPEGRNSRPQSVLIAAYQPSYYQNHKGEIVKISASPSPADYRLLKRVLAFGERTKLPLITFVDVLGAKATPQAELDGLSTELSDCIDAVNHYDGAAMTYITGVLGSGGGVALTAFGQRVVMLEDAQAYVAEPESTSAITDKNASAEKVQANALSSSPTAEDQKAKGLIHDVLYLPDDPYTNPFGMAVAIRDDIAAHLPDLLKLSSQEREEMVDKRLSNLPDIHRLVHP